MAGLRGRAVANSNTTTTSAKTMLQIAAPSTAGVRVDRCSISFDGTNPAGPKVKVELVKGATSGTGSSLTPAKVDGHTGSLTATAKENFSGEPSGGTVIFSEWVHPQSGYTAPEPIQLNPSETLGIRVTTATAVNAVSRMNFEE